jgi:hypothetical protein
MKSIILTLTLILVASAVFAQNFSGPPSFTPDVLDNPIDGGLGLLLGAGAVYGATRLKSYRKRNK